MKACWACWMHRRRPGWSRRARRWRSSRRWAGRRSPCLPGHWQPPATVFPPALPLNLPLPERSPFPHTAKQSNTPAGHAAQATCPSRRPKPWPGSTHSICQTMSNTTPPHRCCSRTPPEAGACGHRLLDLLRSPFAAARRLGSHIGRSAFPRRSHRRSRTLAPRRIGPPCGDIDLYGVETQEYRAAYQEYLRLRNSEAFQAEVRKALSR